MTHGNFVFYNPVKILFGKAQIANITAGISVDAKTYHYLE
jgi:NADP-dependent alcohol dehydrogenase